MGYKFLLNGFLFLLLVIQPIPDINASEVPIPERNFNTGNSFIQDIFIMENILFTAEKYDGFRLVNVSDPSNPQELWHFPLNNFKNNEKTIGNPGVLVEAQLVHVVNNTAFFATTDVLYIFDVSNPRDPVFLGVLDLYAQSMTSKNNFLYILYRFEILEINVSDPFVILSYTYNDYLFSISMELIIENDFLYVNQDSSLLIFDLTNTTPIFNTFYDYNGTYSLTEFDVSGDLLALVTESNEVQFLNITEIENIIPVNSIQFDFNVNTLAIDNDNIFVSISGSILIYDISDLMELTLINEYKLESMIPGEKNCNSILFSDDLAFLNTGVHGIRIIDISDLQNIILKGVNDPYSDQFSNVYCSNDILYVNSPYDGLQLFSIDGQKVEHIGNYNTSFTDIEVQGGLAFLAIDSGLQIIDISNKTNIKIISNYEDHESYFGDRKMEIHGNLVYLTAKNGFQIVEIDEIENPTLLKYHIVNKNSTDIIVKNDFIYSIGEEGLQIYQEIEGEITIIDSFYEGIPTSDLIVDNDLVYVWNRFGISILDVSFPYNIEILGKIDILDMQTNRFHFIKFELHEKYLFVFDDLGYIEVYDISVSYNPGLIDQISLSETDIVAFRDFTIYENKLIVIGTLFGSIYELNSLVPNVSLYGPLEEENSTDYYKIFILIVIILGIIYYYISRKKRRTLDGS